LISNLVYALLIVIFYILQTTVFSQTVLISGTADILLLFFAAWSLQEQVKNTWIWTIIAGFLISLISAMPYFAPLLAYLGVVAISKLIQRRVWKIPILAMFIVTLLGTFLQHIIYFIVLQLDGVSISLAQSLDMITLPSLLLNLIIALPIFAVVNEVVGRLYPLEVEV
jgi:rod shape-determining protein MreD